MGAGIAVGLAPGAFASHVRECDACRGEQECVIADRILAGYAPSTLLANIETQTNGNWKPNELLTNRGRYMREWNGKAARRQPRNPKPGLTHCKHGHEYTSVNTIVLPDGRRNCRVCRRLQQAEYKKRKREREGVSQ